jgi:hypothetical protein
MNDENEVNEPSLQANSDSPEEEDDFIIEDAIVDRYSVYLKEPYRPPSKGGNTTALHCHVIVVKGEEYTFLARGSKKWVYANETVTFAYRIKDGKYKNIVKESLFSCNSKGEVFTRGDRSYKKTLRTSSYKR